MTDMEIPQAAIDAMRRAIPGGAPQRDVERGLAAALPHLLTEVKSSAFEQLLAAPNEQFDKRSEVLASIEAYSKAPSSTAGAQVPTVHRGTVYTDAEVKSMCETATALGLALGRKEAAEEFLLLAQTLHEFAANDRKRMRQASDAVSKATYKHRADGYGDSAEGIERVARDMAPQASQPVSNGLTASSRHPDTPEMVGGSKTPPRHDATYPMDEPLTEAMQRALKRQEDCPGCGQNGTGLENHRSDRERNPAYLPEESDQ